MVQTYSDNKYIYSVDMMFVYIRKNKLKQNEVHIKVSDFIHQLKHNVWGNPEKNIKYSPMSVILNPTSNSKEHERILTVDLSYPIIISTNGNVIDGMHRLSKAYIEKKEYIVAYMFDTHLLHKFIIGTKDEWTKVNNMTIYDFINLYVDRFCK